MRNYARDVFWGKPPADPKERRLLNKLDGVILSYVCLSYFCNCTFVFCASCIEVEVSPVGEGERE
jgi:hypothetical protein